MLPFATYTIPEITANKTILDGKWLLFITEREPTMPQQDLIQKIGAALHADVEKDAVSFSRSIFTDVSIQDMVNSSSKLLISFGLLPSSLGLWIDLSTPGIRFLETLTFILTLPIADLEKNAPAKKELWKNMQLYLESKEKQHG